ncbi:hypothetical protein NDU88_005012 [Pleurodeles waltl]|uniref:Uncharacterized protein n=1 Tax=Pleurodeles waltl TaxID=8319 RepID=A0AAV7RJV2_PLEWA|nr:hypothetical protein NDU88_005012 [Pleurodeles waltl]
MLCAQRCLALGTGCKSRALSRNALLGSGPETSLRGPQRRAAPHAPARRPERPQAVPRRGGSPSGQRPPHADPLLTSRVSAGSVAVVLDGPAPHSVPSTGIKINIRVRGRAPGRAAGLSPAAGVRSEGLGPRAPLSLRRLRGAGRSGHGFPWVLGGRWSPCGRHKSPLPALPALGAGTPPAPAAPARHTALQCGRAPRGAPESRHARRGPGKTLGGNPRPVGTWRDKNPSGIEHLG